jgi:transcriptional regulator with XRE-family HTH domain
VPTLGERLRRAREKKNLTQVAVRERTGINNKTLSGYEKGVSEPDIETLKKLAALYEVSVDWITGNNNVYNDKPKSHNLSEDKVLYDALDRRKRKLLDAYDKLPKDKQNILDQLAEVMMKEIDLQKKDDNH